MRPEPASIPNLAPETGEEIRAALDALDQQVQIARITNDPLLHPLQALAATVRALNRLFVDGTLTLSQTIGEARRPLTKEELATLERAATRGFANQAAAFVRAQNLRTALIAGGVLVGGIVLAGGGGYWWGHRSAKAVIAETETGLQTAFQNGPEAAREWWSLMAWNDPRKALAECKLSVQAGRRACQVPLWIEPPPAPGQGR